MKLKPIPENTVVNTQTEAEAKELLTILHENGYKWGDGDSLKSNLSESDLEFTYILTPYPTVFKTPYMTGAIPLAEFKERYCEMTEQLTEKAEESSVIPDEAKDDTMDDTKELNLCELLKGHEGETFFSPISNNPLKLKAVFGRSLTFFLDEEEELSVDFDGGGRITMPSLNGDFQLKYITDLKSRCLLYPSRALYEQYPLDATKAWSVWQEEQEKKHYQDYSNRVGCEIVRPLLDKVLPSDRDKCIEEIKAIIEKYSKE